MTLEPIAVALVVATVLVIGAGVRPRRAARIVDPPTANHRPATGSTRPVDGAISRFRSRPVIRPGGVASWCDDVARRVRSGSSLSHALVESVPDDADIRAATAGLRLAIERGRPVADAVSNVADSDPSERLIKRTTYL